MYNSILKELLEMIKKEISSEMSRFMESMGENDSTEWITEQRAREILGVSRGTLYKYRKEGILPFSKFNRKIYYRRSDLDNFLETNYSGDLRKGGRHE